VTVFDALHDMGGSGWCSVTCQRVPAVGGFLSRRPECSLSAGSGKPERRPPERARTNRQKGRSAAAELPGKRESAKTAWNASVELRWKKRLGQRRCARPQFSGILSHLARWRFVSVAPDLSWLADDPNDHDWTLVLTDASSYVTAENMKRARPCKASSKRPQLA
jgi:hypothetical protein